jgi:hypothetical protein
MMAISSKNVAEIPPHINLNKNDVDRVFLSVTHTLLYYENAG